MVYLNSKNLSKQLVLNVKFNRQGLTCLILLHPPPIFELDVVYPDQNGA